MRADARSRMNARARKATIAVGVTLIVGVILAVALKGCALMPWNGSAVGGRGGSVSLSVTRDFGRRAVANKAVSVGRGDSVMSVLGRSVDVDTDYGGGFVSSIEGLASRTSSGSGNDWFYYVNGVLSGTGAAEYEVRDGDSVWWDFHPWGGRTFIPAVVGSYPSPFTKGYGAGRAATTVFYGPTLETLARKVGAYLEGLGARVEYRSGLPTSPGAGVEGPSMVFATPADAGGNRGVGKLLGDPAANGVFLKVKGQSLVALDEKGEPSPTAERLNAAVVASGSGMGDAQPVWLVVCAGPDGAAAAGRLLTARPEKLRGKFGAAVGERGAVYALPR